MTRPVSVRDSDGSAWYRQSDGTYRMRRGDGAWSSSYVGWSLELIERDFGPLMSKAFDDNQGSWHLRKS